MRRAEAAKAVTVAAIILGTVPAVGGYSNTVIHARGSQNGDFTTVGIVTEVVGGSFGVEAGQSAATELAPGRGIQTGDRIWVEPSSIVRVTDTQGGRITVAGPASVEFLHRTRTGTTVRLYKGSVKFHPVDGQTMAFENAFVAGTVAGEGAVWASGQHVQVLGLSGDVKAWHPRLASAAVLVTPGFFTESSTAFKFLQPRRPERVDPSRFESFLSRFDESHEALPAAEPARGLASETPETSEAEVHESAPRTRAELVEDKSPEAERLLRAHISGRGYDEPEDRPLAVAGPRYNAFSSRSNGRKPSFTVEVIKK